MLVSELGYDYAASGRKADAQKVLQELQHRTATEFVDPYTVGWIYVALSPWFVPRLPSVVPPGQNPFVSG